MKYNSLFYRVYHWLAQIPPKVRWSSKYAVDDHDKEHLANILSKGYYVILTGNKSHLSGVLVSLLSWLKTGKWARYSHALMNCDNIEDPNNRGGFKFIEATATGVGYATFDEVFACDTVCLLSPTMVKNTEWTAVIDELLNQIGKPYDDLFDLSDSTHVSCVEVVLDALEKADYIDEFKNLNAMIKKEGNLIPQMYRDCSDFTSVFEK